MYFDKDTLIMQYYKEKNPRIKEKIILAYKSLVEYIAKKMAYNRDDFYDLVQVGTIGLMKSIDRYKPSRDTDFSTFATPNIIGEIKHYFRDKGQILKVPRRLQEQYAKIRGYIKTHTQESGQSPTITQIADALNISEEEVLESMEAGNSMQVISLDTPLRNEKYSDDANSSLLDNLGVSSNIDNLLVEESLKEAIQALGEREKLIIKLRFYDGFTQREIAEKLSISQMHVSRLLTYAIKSLRKYLKVNSHSPS